MGKCLSGLQSISPGKFALWEEDRKGGFLLFLLGRIWADSERDNSSLSEFPIP